LWYSGYNDVMGYPNGGDNRIAPDEMIDVCKLTPDNPVSWHPFSGQSWSQCWYGYVLYNHVASPNSEIPDCTPWNANPNSWLDHSQQSPTEGMFTARSWHPGGVNVLFLDGHVKFISDSVDLGVWRGMASIDGGEKIDLP
jgi:prepilin-type processing-associated H-X9-DG protein